MNERKDILSILDGCEIVTAIYETYSGVVGVEKGKIIADGKVIDENPTLERLRGLWSEYLEYVQKLSRKQMLNILERVKVSTKLYDTRTGDIEIYAGKVYGDGKILDENPSLERLQGLYVEYMRQ